MELFEKTNWKEEKDNISSKADFLNGMKFEEVSNTQQMLYLMWKKIEELEARITELEEIVSKSIRSVE